MSQIIIGTISLEDLTDSSKENVERLAKFLKMRVDPNWDKETLCKRVFWEVIPPQQASMY